MSNETSLGSLDAEIERELHHAIRRAWRSVTPDWRDREAATVVSAASVAVTREHPDWTDEQVGEELTRLGVLLVTPLGRALVRVPPLPGEPVPPVAGGVQ